MKLLSELVTIITQIPESRLLKVPTSADEGKLPVIRADKIPAVYHDTTLAAIVIEGDKVIDKISGKELTKVGSPQIIDGGIHSPTNSDYYMLELEGVEGLPVAVSFDYQGDESPDNSDIIIINGTCSYYNLNGVSFCRTQGGGNNVKIDNEPIGVSEVYRNYVIQVSSDNYESKTPPVAFIAGESKSPTYEGSFPSMSPLSSVKVCGRFGKIKNILISSAFPYTGNFTPRGDGVEGFGVPEKREPGWNYETLDEAANGRLLPANPANGDIPCFDATATIGGGNDANTKLLLQPATSDGLIVDQAAGNAAPVSITNSGNVAIEDNALVFTGTNSLLIPANALGMTLGGNNEFMIDIEFQLDSVKSDYATLYGYDGGSSGACGALYFTSGGDAHFTMSLGPDTTGWTLGTKHRITIERWNDNGTWKTSVYRNGSFLASSTSGMNILSDYVFPIGSNTYSTNRNFIGKIWAFRISNKAIHGGQSFTPDALPWTKPQTVGEWGKLNKSKLALKSDVFSAWHQLSGSSAITLDRADGELQKVTLTQNCTLTAPVLDADHPTLLLQVTSSSAVTVTVGETNIVTDHTGTFQVGWYWDGEATRRYPVVEVA